MENLTILKKNEKYKLKKKILITFFYKKIFYQNIAEIFINKKKLIMKINYDWKVIKKQLQGSPKKHCQKSHQKKYSQKSIKSSQKKKHIYFRKKACQKKSYKKVLKRKKTNHI